MSLFFSAEETEGQGQFMEIGLGDAQDRVQAPYGDDVQGPEKVRVPSKQARVEPAFQFL